MKLVDKYQAQTLIINFLIVLLSLGIIFTIFKLIDESTHIDGIQYSFLSVLNFVLLYFPEIIRQILVVSIFIGTVMSISYFVRNRELQIFYTAGLSSSLIATKIIKISMLIFIIFFLILDFSAPLASKYADTYKRNLLGSSANLNLTNIWFRSEEKFVFIEKIDEFGAPINIRIISIANNEPQSILYSEIGEVKDKSLRLKNLKKLSFDHSKKILAIKKEESAIANTDISLTESQIENLKISPRKMNIVELVQQLIFLRQKSLDAKDYKIEFYSRINAPISLFGILLLSLPYAFSINRNSSVIKKVMFSVSIGLAAHFLTKLFLSLAIKNGFGYFLAIILPSLLIIFFGIINFKRIKYSL